ncbi:alpha/beta hydrolase [Streptomyces avidinii]|uniref:Pimeloyl-ACP methyl ester carboxylesterase n=1 Tax=Streptomyces avidinii TaxID=1895 RepID=A0ABS4L0V7_STRAV|nr:alpha/beta hydrolase [Streptomyces avidinii]MBP2035540.1 pimeloyl-ACP methyl ester carboxylesterase [Streptomyces avidinii]GGZ01749.1 alpha/beta hydrolase [Streptomyces avidinii]
MRQKRRLAPLLAAAGLVATTVPLLSATQASAAPASDHLRQKPAWHRCSPEGPASYECATLKVPLDYRRPDGRTIDLAISRMKSENPAKRHGAMLLNPGGPGGSGLDLPLLMNDAMPKDVREQYDLIGFDPRGVGASSPLTCGLTDAEQNFDRAYRPETFGSDVTWARTVADKCREKAGSVLPHITTRNTARDMDTIRAVLGERKLSYVGYSYGTYLGAVYSQMFPDRTDRFVLDSGVDPQRIWRGMIQVWATEAEPAFARWTQWAAQRSAEYGLGDTPKAVSETFWGLVARADKEPIELDGMKVDGDMIRAARGVFFYPAQATPMVVALKAAAEGKPLPADVTGTQLKRLLGGAAAEPASDNGTAVFWAVACGDTGSWPRYTEQYERDAAKDKAKYPLYGDFASNIKPCAFWDRPAEAATPMNKKANVLTVQNEWDSQTPLVSGQGLHRALKGSRMVLAAGGEGHGVYLFDPTSCANAPVNAYLTTGRLPDRDVTCQNPPAAAERRDAAAPSKRLPFPSGPARF